MRDYDRYDLALLKRLQEDALLTAEELAVDISLSPSAIARRIRRMREDGTILGNIAVVSEKIGPYLSAFIDVQLDRHAPPELEGLLRRLMANPHVQSLMEVTGASDLVLRVVVKNMEDFNRFADEVLAIDPIVRRYETRFIKKNRKHSVALPIDLDAGSS